MINSFREQNKILCSVKILEKTAVKESVYTARLIEKSLAPEDFLDLNGDGKVQTDFDTFGGNIRGTTIFESVEPALVSPSYQQIKTMGEKSGRKIVTQDDLPQGVFVADVQSYDSDNNERKNYRPLNALVNTLPDEFEPRAKFAFDLAANELLVYKEEPVFQPQTMAGGHTREE